MHRTSRIQHARILNGVFLVCAGGLLATFVNAQTNQQGQMGSVVFSHVAVIDTAHSSVQNDMTVVIAGDHITEVGKPAEIKIPNSVRIIDGHGKFLMPGLWDMHVHTFNHNPTARSTHTWFFPLFIANGVTGVRDMWTTGEDFPQVVQFRKGLADGSFVGPRYGAVGWMVDGPEGIFPYSDVVKTPEGARDFVHKVKAAGIDFVKVYWNLPRQEYFAIADESKKIGLPFAGHVPLAISAREAADAGQKSIEHLDGLVVACSTKEPELLQVKRWNAAATQEALDTYNRDKCDKLVATFAHNQTWQVPTLAGGEEISASDPRIKYLPASVRPARIEAANQVRSPEQQQLHKRGREMRLNMIAALANAGVPIMAGTDVAAGRLFPGFSLHDELAIFVRAGLSPGEAIKTATYNPAKFLGMLDRLGTVEKGKLADLVLLDANPLEDIHNTQKIRGVVLNGRYLDRSALDELLTDAEAGGSRQD